MVSNWFVNCRFYKRTVIKLVFKNRKIKENPKFNQLKPKFYLTKIIITNHSTFMPNQEGKKITSGVNSFIINLSYYWSN